MFLYVGRVTRLLRIFAFFLPSGPYSPQLVHMYSVLILRISPR
jgi:hypothetical protein